MTCIGNQRRLYTYDKIQIKDKCSKLKTQYATDWKPNECVTNP